MFHSMLCACFSPSSSVRRLCRVGVHFQLFQFHLFDLLFFSCPLAVCPAPRVTYSLMAPQGVAEVSPSPSAVDPHAVSDGMDGDIPTPRQNPGLAPLNIQSDPLQNGYPQTPAGDVAAVYRFYCPLCCMYFQMLYKTSCCRNYICKPDMLGYLKSKLHQLPRDLADLPASHAPVDCPHCATPKVTFSLVTPTDKPRNYGESPSTKVHLERLRSQTTAGHAVR